MKSIIDPETDNESMVFAPCPHCGTPTKNYEAMLRMIGAAACDKCIEDYRLRKASESARGDSEDREPTPFDHYEIACPVEFQQQPLMNLCDQFAFKQAADFNILDIEKTRGKGLLLYGASRTGKTRCAWYIVGGLVRIGRANTFAWFGGNDFARSSADAARNSREEKWMRHLTSVSLVVLDDLGKFTMTPRVESDLFDLIDKRLNAHKPIIITTNFVGSSLTAKFKDEHTAKAIIARLREKSEMIHFSEKRIIGPEMKQAECI